jgi:hypothetical protein
VSEENDLERANRIAERIKSDPRVAQIVSDAQAFDALRIDPGWQRLYSRVVARKERWMTNVLVRFMGPKKNWPEPDEIAYYQGFYQGAVFVLAHPEHAEHNLERAARLAWAMTYEDEPLGGDVE